MTQLQNVFVAPAWVRSAAIAENNNNIYIVGYCGISILVSLLGTFKFLWVYLGAIRASRALFSTMTSAVLHASLQWLDAVPKGRILNRFIADFNVIDSNLGNELVLLFHSGLQFVGITVAGTLVSPFLLLAVVPLVITCIAYAKMYLAGARDVKRLGKS